MGGMNLKIFLKVFRIIIIFYINNYDVCTLEPCYLRGQEKINIDILRGGVA